MAYNGTGTFNRLYSWATDALNGLFISSSRMDNEMNGMATGLTNCLTRDGQSPPTANIPMNGKKITGLANGTAATDAASFGQLATANSPWITEINSVSFISVSSFKVLGLDLTSVYSKGRRVKYIVASGATTGYGIVLSATFATDTTVSLIGMTAVLDATLSSMQYGILDSVRLANPVAGGGANNTAAGASASMVTGTAVQVNIPAFVPDLLAEYSSGTFVYRFTTVNSSAYSGKIFRGIMLISTAAGTTAVNLTSIVITPYRNGGAMTALQTVTWPFPNSTAATMAIPFGFSDIGTAGDIITFRVTMTFTGTAPTVTMTAFQVSSMDGL